MPIITLNTTIEAPVKMCFDLSRSIDLHKISTQKTNEEAIEGKITGLIGLNETVKWRARHFGVMQTLTVRITEYHPPHHFRDEMIQGIFKSFVHNHTFGAINPNRTLMTDELHFRAPLGILGKIAETVVLKTYLSRFLAIRNQVIKDFAESEKWKLIPGMKESQEA
ncbi:MAG: SRPBCC family protein [Bacteroidia bacterium]